MEQVIKQSGSLPEFLAEICAERSVQRLLVVCGRHCRKLEVASSMENIAAPELVWFDDFAPNPDYSSVVSGVALYSERGCDGILAIGGGSALDVAKCIKLFHGLPTGENMLKLTPIPNEIPLIVVPTTAGTGSEATRFAVIYYQGEKQSVTSTDVIPEYVFMDPSVLKGLPPYQKGATVMDAMCHAVESYWSVNSTAESREYSSLAIRTILDNLEGYLANEDQALVNMLKASNLAGKAINITQTTAGHAMCYKLTSLYHIAHGHAASLCVNVLWPYMLDHTSDCCDPRGEAYLQSMFAELAGCFDQTEPAAACSCFRAITDRLGLAMESPLTEENLRILTESVNPVRLKNNPVVLNKSALEHLYLEIFAK